MIKIRSIACIAEREREREGEGRKGSLVLSCGSSHVKLPAVNDRARIMIRAT